MPPNAKDHRPRADFTLPRSDFGLMPGQREEKVSATIELTLSIAGASPR